MNILFIGTNVPDGEELSRNVSPAGNRFQNNVIKNLRSMGHKVKNLSFTTDGRSRAEVMKEALILRRNIRGYGKRADLAICYDILWPWLDLPGMMKKAGGKSLVLMADLSGPECFTSPARKAYANAMISSLSHFDIVVGLSENVKKYMKPEQDFIYLPGGIDREFYDRFDAPFCGAEDGVFTAVFSGLLSPVTGADLLLSAMELTYDADFRGSNRGDGDLRDTEFKSSDFGDADLRDADFRGSNRGDGDLRDTEFKGSDFGDPDLRDADLRGSNRGDGDLRDADFRGTGFKGSDFRLVVTGKGELEERFRQASQKDSRIIFKGLLPYDEYLDVLKNADVLLNPRRMSLPENQNNFPSKFMEYLGCGRPIISTRFAGWEHFTENAFWCDETPEGVMNAIMEARNSFSPEKNEQIYSVNRETAKKYLWENELESMLEGRGKQML